ncbi:MAG: amidophosphoribosyltransferase [Pseudomonadaceae bacterium]|nr:amidophosphoribosyltransferase [Pseudomonadaceae bacterium]
MCGVVGISGHERAAAKLVLGLNALQHRGQEAAGIGVFDGSYIHRERHEGLVGKNFALDDDGAPRPALQRLHGFMGIAHNRYSTAKSTGDNTYEKRSIQPFSIVTRDGQLCLAHNGNLTNNQAMRPKLEAEGAVFQSDSDSELFMHLARTAPCSGMDLRLAYACRQVEGAFAIVAMDDGGRLYGARDAKGIRPLVLGQRDDGHYVLASETIALDAMDASFVREIKNGELVTIQGKDLTSTLFTLDQQPPRPCLFEAVYFAHPDSMYNGHTYGHWRKRMGEQLYLETRDLQPDVIVGVPDSGMDAALGYAQASGIPLEFGMRRKHYVGRTFIDPDTNGRSNKVRQKLTVNRDAVAGKHVLAIDDSLVRGTTSKQVVDYLRSMGAREVSLLLASPRVLYPDYYGIDLATSRELLASRMEHEALRDYIGADHLHFISVEGIYRAVGYSGRDAERPQFSDHVFTGAYPTPLTDMECHHQSERTAR